MTPDELQICQALDTCTMLPGSWDKRFAKNMAASATNQPKQELSPGAKEWIYRLVYKYRAQIPTTYQKHRGNPFCKRKKER